MAVELADDVLEVDVGRGQSERKFQAAPDVARTGRWEPDTRFAVEVEGDVPSIWT